MERAALLDAGQNPDRDIFCTLILLARYKQVEATTRHYCTDHHFGCIQLSFIFITGR
jgi:hypothetical protein